MNRPFGRHQLRTRVTVIATLVTLAMMSLAAVAMLVVQQRQLFDAVDVSLEETVAEVSSEFDISFERPERGERRGPDLPGDIELALRVSTSSRSLQLLNRDGDVITASGALVGAPALIDPRDVTDDPTESVGEFATVERNDVHYRIAATEADKGQILIAGYSLADVNESLRTQRGTLIVAIPLLSALVGYLIWLVLGRALKPVEAIREEVAGISAHELDRRVPVPERSVELASLATTMNDMLARLDRSATRQNRFVSDAAHELRSPLAGIRGQLEVNIHHPEAPERAESEEAMLAETVRMQALVDNLLLLARADHGTLDVPQVEVDLDDLVLDEAAQLRRTTELDVHTEAVSGAQVIGDATQLRRVIRNLADNASRLAERSIRFELAEAHDGVRLAVTDDGPGVPIADAETVFERFTRLDESRSRDVGGSGLGLAISREIIERHGGTIGLDTDNAAGARFVIWLPSS